MALLPAEAGEAMPDRPQARSGGDGSAGFTGAAGDLWVSTGALFPEGAGNKMRPEDRLPDIEAEEPALIGSEARGKAWAVA